MRRDGSETARPDTHKRFPPTLRWKSLTKISVKVPNASKSVSFSHLYFGIPSSKSKIRVNHVLRKLSEKYQFTVHLNLFTRLHRLIQVIGILCDQFVEFLVLGKASEHEIMNQLYPVGINIISLLASDLSCPANTLDS